MTRIVVGYTATETAQEAARHAFSLAEALGATLHLVSAVEAVDTEVVQVGSDRYEVDTAQGVRSEAQRFVDALRSPVTVEISVHEGEPAKAILSEAERVNADIIVVGNVRMQGIGRVLGSVGSAIVHHAPCDVYIVKTT